MVFGTCRNFRCTIRVSKRRNQMLYVYTNCMNSKPIAIFLLSIEKWCTKPGLQRWLPAMLRSHDGPPPVPPPYRPESPAPDPAAASGLPCRQINSSLSGSETIHYRQSDFSVSCHLAGKWPDLNQVTCCTGNLCLWRIHPALKQYWFECIYASDFDVSTAP